MVKDKGYNTFTLVFALDVNFITLFRSLHLVTNNHCKTIPHFRNSHAMQVLTLKSKQREKLLIPDSE